MKTTTLVIPRHFTPTSNYLFCFCFDRGTPSASEGHKQSIRLDLCVRTVSSHSVVVATVTVVTRHLFSKCGRCNRLLQKDRAGGSLSGWDWLYAWNMNRSELVFKGFCKQCATFSLCHVWSNEIKTLEIQLSDEKKNPTSIRLKRIWAVWTQDASITLETLYSSLIISMINAAMLRKSVRDLLLSKLYKCLIILNTGWIVTEKQLVWFLSYTLLLLIFLWDVLGAVMWPIISPESPWLDKKKKQNRDGHSGWRRQRKEEGGVQI